MTNYSILQTLVAIKDSDKPICIDTIQSITGFGKRKAQHHTKALVDAGLTKSIGKQKKDGYRYQFIPPAVKPRPSRAWISGGRDKEQKT